MLNQALQPMLLQPVLPIDIKKDWKSSLKWDGFRILIHYDHGKVRAFTRHGTEVTSRFPELLEIKLQAKTAIIDGECIAFDLNQSNDAPPKIWWDDAMTRFNTKSPDAVKRISLKLKAHFPLWDVLFVNGESLLHKTFMERRDVLSSIVQKSDELSVTPMYDDGCALFKRAKELELEGICQYNPKSNYYLSTRPLGVITKVKHYQHIICQVYFINKRKFGWGLIKNGVHMGVLEFPPSMDIKKEFYKFSKQLICKEEKNMIFLDPFISCKVKFQCFTKNGKLRSPVFVEFCTINSVTE
jgi:ATP-dependent DNA ligase